MSLEARILSVGDQIARISRRLPSLGYQFRRPSAVFPGPEPATDDAIARIEEHLPDLIITDLMMPVMGGVELYRRLKDRGETREIPIIIMSAGLGWPRELVKELSE